MATLKTIIVRKPEQLPKVENPTGIILGRNLRKKTLIKNNKKKVKKRLLK